MNKLALPISVYLFTFPYQRCVCKGAAVLCFRAGVAFIRDRSGEDRPGGKPQKTDPGSDDDVHSMLGAEPQER